MIEKKVSLPENLAQDIEEKSDELGISESEIIRSSILQQGLTGEKNGQ